MSLRFDCAEDAGRERGLIRAVAAIAEGELVCLPTESSYALACDAFSPQAIEELVFTRGSVPGQAPPVMIAHTRALEGIARDVSDAARSLAAAFWPGPLTMILNAQPTLRWDLGGPAGVVAVRVPLHPITLALLERTGPLAVTAGNVVGHPVPLNCQEARDQLGEAVGVYLDGGQAIRTGASTVVDARGPLIRLVRAGLATREQLHAVIGEALEDSALPE